MKIGLIKTSLIDYPEHVAGVVFYSGCNLRCPYCHNPELVFGEPPRDNLDKKGLEDFLRKRASVLDGMVITGGEPTLQPSLQDLIDMIKFYDLDVKLDTNGLLPDVLKSLKGLDFVAMDVKTSIKGYGRLIPSSKTVFNEHDYRERLSNSIDYILHSGIRHQFRTTLVENIVKADDMPEICAMIRGCDEYRLTRFRPGTTLIEGFSGNTSDSYVDSVIRICENEGIRVKLA